MAESVSSDVRYFCHKCREETVPKMPDLTCPKCVLGFIEELSNDQPNGEDQSIEYDFSEGEWTASQLVNNMENLYGRYANWPANGSQAGSNTSSSSNSSSGHDSSPEMAEQNGGVLGRFIQEFMSVEPYMLEITPYFHILHSSPGDYVWGPHGIDEVITQILNAKAAPPMSKQAIEKLPVVSITEDEVNKNLQCSVCMEDYKIDEPVKKLQCGHLYHNDCIVEWLKMHATCPICRKLLNNDSLSQSSSDARSSPSSSSSQQTSTSTSGRVYQDINDYD